MIVFILTGCNVVKSSDFKEYKQDFLIVSDTAKSYFESHNTDEHLTLTFDEYLLWADVSVEKSISKLSEMDFDYIWVSSDYVIFWKDEMKTYGILYSDSPNSAIIQLKSWYYGMEYNKIEKNWYEIGQLSSI